MENNQKRDPKSPEELKQFVDENFHKVRNCFDYYDEYEECKSIKGRFHQYFIFGEFQSCSSWKSDSENCFKAKENRDRNLEGLASIIRHEDERRERRLKDHLNNDVWPKRTEPPPNWSGELPEWMVEKMKAQELTTRRFECVIS